MQERERAGGPRETSTTWPACLLAPLLMALATGSKGLFMSAASANASDSALQAYLRSAALACHSSPWNLSSSPQHIHSVAIQAVGDHDGMIYASALDHMIPALSCVSRIYVGTTIPRGNDFYCADAERHFRGCCCQRLRQAARAFIARYGDVLPPSFAWYIAPEQFLNHLAEGCGRSRRAGSSGRPHTPLLRSPQPGALSTLGRSLWRPFGQEHASCSRPLRICAHGQWQGGCGGLPRSVIHCAPSRSRATDHRYSHPG